MRRAGLERLGVRTQTGTNGQQRTTLLILCPLVTVHARTQVVSASPGTGRSSYKRAAPFLFSRVRRVDSRLVAASAPSLFQPDSPQEPPLGRSQRLWGIRIQRIAARIKQIVRTGVNPRGARTNRLWGRGVRAFRCV